MFRNPRPTGIALTLFLAFMLPLRREPAEFRCFAQRELFTAFASQVNKFRTNAIQANQRPDRNGNYAPEPERVWTEASARAELRRLILYIGAIEIALALLVAGLCGFVLALAMVAGGEPDPEPKISSRIRKQLHRLLPDRLRIRKQPVTYGVQNPDFENRGFDL